MVEGARLESVFRGNSNVGSNPTLSARLTISPFPIASSTVHCQSVIRAGDHSGTIAAFDASKPVVGFQAWPRPWIDDARSALHSPRRVDFGGSIHSKATIAISAREAEGRYKAAGIAVA